jgi:tagaturonate reductase
MHSLPETILQFGAGNFLRAFADVFVHEANQEGQNIGRIVVVQSTNSNRAQMLNDQNGHYHVLTRGIENGQKIDHARKVESISRALIAQNDWPEILAFAQSPNLKYILSNVTEVGFVLDPNDLCTQNAPHSFPAKLLQVLKARFEAHQPGLTILPCELIERNGDLLLGLLIEQAKAWHLGDDFQSWLRQENIWCNTLVDRIVSGLPDNHPLLQEDQLLAAAEPYALWAIESPHGLDGFVTHPNIVQTDKVDPYQLRKVRILNGAHTAMVIRAMPLGIETVREAIENKDIYDGLKRLLFEEICPVVDARVDQAEKFAHQVFDRFANPFLNHKLSDIALHQETKIQTRLVPTYKEYMAQFGKQPPLLHDILKEHL